MGDLLIRNMPESLKQEITALARREGHSLSDEIKRLLQKGLAAPDEKRRSEAADTYVEFRQEFADVLLTDEEHQEMMSAIDAWKKEGLSPNAEAAE